MTHFSNQAWIDFIRDRVSPRQKTVMESHLSAGCKICAASLEGWRSYLKSNEGDAGRIIPAPALRTVINLWIGKLDKATASIALQIAQLVFDSAREPLPAGARTGSPSGRQYVFATKQFTVDMQEVSQAGSSRSLLIGQVTNSAQPRDFASGKQVLLTSGENIVAETFTNQYGEFHLELDEPKEEPLMVSIAVDPETVLVASLTAPQLERASSTQGAKKELHSV